MTALIVIIGLIALLVGNWLADRYYELVESGWDD